MAKTKVFDLWNFRLLRLHHKIPKKYGRIKQFFKDPINFFAFINEFHFSIFTNVMTQARTRQGSLMI